MKGNATSTIRMHLIFAKRVEGENTLNMLFLRTIVFVIGQFFEIRVN